MKRRLHTWFVVGLLAAGAIAARAAESFRIVPIVGDDKVLVSFELADAFTDEIRQAISSGLRTTFTYEIELRMVVPGLGGPDRSDHDRSPPPIGTTT